MHLRGKISDGLFIYENYLNIAFFFFFLGVVYPKINLYCLFCPTQKSYFTNPKADSSHLHYIYRTFTACV